MSGPVLLAQSSPIHGFQHTRFFSFKPFPLNLLKTTLSCQPDLFSVIVLCVCAGLRLWGPKTHMPKTDLLIRLKWSPNSDDQHIKSPIAFIRYRWDCENEFIYMYTCLWWWMVYLHCRPPYFECVFLESLVSLHVRASDLGLTASNIQLFLRAALQRLHTVEDLFRGAQEMYRGVKGLSASQIVRIYAVIYCPQNAPLIFSTFPQRPLRPVIVTL